MVSRPALRSALLAALLPSCTYWSGDPAVLVTSTPAGAEILVDGEATGVTTPSKLDLGGLVGGDHDITLRKSGYTTESRRVFHYTSRYTSQWVTGASDIALPTFPLFWTFGDLLTPFGVRWRYIPHEIHVELYEVGQAPVGAETVALDGH